MKVVLITTIVFSSIILSAQYSPSTFPNIQFYTNLRRVIGNTGLSINKQGNSKFLKTKMENDKDHIKQILSWTPNSGLLIEVKVAKDQGTNGTYIHEVRELGVGSEPIDILSNYLVSPQINAGNPGGTASISSTESFFIWVSEKDALLRKNILTYGVISEYEALYNSALNIKANQTLLENLINNRKLHIYIEIINKYIEIEKSIQIRNETKNLSDQLLAKYKSIKGLEEKLATDFQNIEKANKLNGKIDFFRNIVNFATLSLEVKSVVSQNYQQKVDQASSFDDLKNILGDFKFESETSYDNANGKIIIEKNQKLELEGQLLINLRNGKVPDELLRESILY